MTTTGEIWVTLDSQQVMRTYVKKLRRKLGDDAARPAWIFTEFGVGYRMPEPDEP